MKAEPRSIARRARARAGDRLSGRANAGRDGNRPRQTERTSQGPEATRNDNHPSSVGPGWRGSKAATAAADGRGTRPPQPLSLCSVRT
ncbi:hypothetical protein ACTMU2_24925 [Cupriavidus basilensis]